MKTNIRGPLIATVLCLFAFLPNSFATHLMGGSMSYEYLGIFSGNYRYRITLKVYNNCGTTSNVPYVEQSVEIGVYEEDANFPNNDKNLYQSYIVGVTDSNIVQAQLSTNCTVGTGICIKEGIFETDIDLPFSTDGYHVAYQRCCRNGNIDNLSNPGDAAMIFTAFIPPHNISGPPNSTPVLQNLSVPYVCAADTTTLLNNAVDPDGDSLSFSFVLPYNGMATSAGSPGPSPGATSTLDWPISTVTYMTGFSQTQPFGGTGYASINALTGLTKFYAPNTGFFVVSVEIEEWRNGQLIVTTRRDIQLLVITCPFNPPPNLSAQGGSGQTSWTIMEGDTLCFPVTFTDQNGDSVFLSKSSSSGLFNPAIVNPPATLPDAEGDSILSTQFCWETTCGQAGNYQFAVTVTDNGCPPKETPELYNITVQPYIPPDTIFGVESACTGETFTYIANGSVGFMNWVVTGGNVVSTPGNSIVINWTTPGTAVIKLEPGSGQSCLTDTVYKYIAVIQGPSVSVANDTAICADETVQIGAPPAGAFNFSWSPTTYLDNPNISNPTVTPSSLTVNTAINYVLTVTNAQCVVKDSLLVTINPIPQDTIAGAIDACSRSEYVYTIGNPSGSTYTWWIQGGVINSQTGSSVSVHWNDTSAGVLKMLPVSLAGCVGDTAYKYVNITISPEALAGPDTAFCTTNTITLGGVMDTSFIYSWSPGTYLNDTTIPNPIVNIPNPNTVDTLTYILSVTNNGFCLVEDTVQVELYPVPDNIVIVGTEFVCPGIDGISYWFQQSLPGSTFDWVVVNGTIASGQGTDSITVDWNSVPGPGMVKVVETTQHGCISDSAYFPVSINVVLEPEMPEGPTVICAGERDSLSYVTFNTANSAYNWFVGNGTVVQGDGTSDVLITWDSVTTPTEGWVFVQEYVVADSVCNGYSDTLFVTLYPSPTTSAISGDFTVCENDENLLYFVNGDAGSDFTWEIIGAGQITSGKGTDSITVRWVDSGTFVITVIEESIYGCFGDTIKANVTVYPFPTASKIQGEDFVCAPDFDAQPYWLPGFDGSTYDWIIDGGLVASGAGTDSVNIDWDPFGPGEIMVVETTQYGCVGDTVTKTVQFDLPELQMTVVTDDEDDENKIKVEWELINGQFFKGFFRVWKKEFGKDTAWTFLGMVDTTYFEEDGVLTDDFSFEYRIEMLNKCGDTVSSPPHNSILLTGTNDEMTKEVQLNWTAYRNWDNGVRVYEIYRKLEFTGDYALYADVLSDTIVLYENGKDGFRHCYRIRAEENSTGVESWSNEICLDFRHLITIPEAISPNGDGVNDYWVIDNIDMYPNNNVQVFNRWGNKVYEQDGYDNTWDGTRNGKQLPDAAYYYIVDLQNNRPPFVGPITILR